MNGKKKPPGKGSKKGPGGPSKKLIELLKQSQVAANEEVEKAEREEEERLRREEEEKKRLEEEEQRKVEEKERKKIKEKERKERLKKEGKLLTTKQKADRKRALESANFMKQQLAGVIEGTVKLEVKDKNKVDKADGDDGGDELADEDGESINLPDGVTLRSPVICVLGHVDAGKTKLLDYIRRTHVQDNEAGGITQQIGATFVPNTAIKEQTKPVKNKVRLNLPGLLIIDTPGHESFTNLRSRGSSLCDIAILVVNMMEGLENQTMESIELLKKRRTPFLVALNKVDRLIDWKKNAHRDIEDQLKQQSPNTKNHFEERVKSIILQFNKLGLNAALYYENPDTKSYVSLVPVSAVTGDGMGNLISMLVSFSQTKLMKRIIFKPNDLNATVFEVKAIQGLGTTLDVILINGTLHVGDKIILAGYDGPITTFIRALLVPHPLKEQRVKSQYTELKSVDGSIGVKVAGHDLEKAVAGLQLHVAKSESDIERMLKFCNSEFEDAMNKIKCMERGVYVQASTLGSLEALLEFLDKPDKQNEQEKIPYSGVRIGPVARKDVMKISAMLEHAPIYACILAFDVRVEKDAQELADQTGVRIFQSDVIYKLTEKFAAHMEDVQKKQREEFKSIAVFPCKLKILPNCIFNKRDPIVVGVEVLAGKLKQETPIYVVGKDIIIGKVTSIQVNHIEKEVAKEGEEVCIKIENTSADAPKMIGRHFEETDMLISHISRESIDACKNYFRKDLEKDDWRLMVELKKVLQII